MNPHDPDPLTSEEYRNAYLDGWADGFSDSPRVTPPSTVAARGVLLGFALGFLAATILATHALAASRSGPAPSIPVAAQARTEAPQSVGGEADWHPAQVATVPLRVSTATPQLSGTASWYPARGFIAAAGPGLRTGDWRGKIVEACLSNEPTRCITVKLADWCACPRRLVDLSDDAFARLAPLSRGLVHVQVTSAGPAPTPPATDR